MVYSFSHRLASKGQAKQAEEMKYLYLLELLCGIIIQLSLIIKNTEDRLNDKEHDRLWQRRVL